MIFQVSPFRVGSWPYLQTFDQAGQTGANTLAYYGRKKTLVLGDIVVKLFSLSLAVK
jgi:hypothetical protein